jgi:hypothetical protein
LVDFLAVGAGIEPGLVVPVVFEGSDDGFANGRNAVAETEGVGFVDLVAVEAGGDVEFVDGAFVSFGDDCLPDSRDAEEAHGVGAFVPAVEVADDGDKFGVGCPDGEGNAAVGEEMGAESFVEAAVGSFVEEVAVLGTELELRRGNGADGFGDDAHGFSFLRMATTARSGISTQSGLEFSSYVIS